MASKLLTETLTQIFSELELDELFSCALVSRGWCQTAVPILWSDPWKKIDDYALIEKFDEEKHILLILTYISCLSEDDRKILNSIGVISSDLTKTRPSFDYPIFLRYLNCNRFVFLTNKFVSGKVEFNGNIITKYIIVKLWNLFKERCRRLVHLELSDHFELVYLDGSINRRPESMFANIRSFQCEGNIQPLLLYELANICKSIRDIKIDKLSQDNDGIAYLIQSQKSIRKLVLGFFYDAPTYGFTKIENVLKDIDSLNQLVLSGRFPLSLNLFSKCSELQDLELLLNESNIGMEEFATNKFPELRDLKICFNKLSVKQLSLLINNTGGKIKKFFILGHGIIDPENSLMLKESIINKCVNLREFVTYIEPIGAILPPLPNLFQRCVHLEIIMIGGKEINGAYPNFGKDLIESVPYIPRNFKYVLVPTSFCSKEELRGFCELVMEQRIFKVSIHEGSSDSDSTLTILFNRLTD
jgi:hypothetical protein